MKNIVGSFLLLMAGLVAHSHDASALGASSPTSGSSVHRGRGGLITCSASDNGWEEHYGGHTGSLIGR